MTRDKFKTYGNVFDEFTNRNIFKLMSQKHIDGLIGPVSIGKEANIFLAKKDDREVIVKIYRLENCDFNKMYDYIRPDPRYSYLKKQRRKIIFAWTQREYRNILKAREAGVLVPTPYALLFNIIVMEMIGKDKPAPRLKDHPPKDPAKFLKKTIDEMRRLYKASLVHADLSPFNILNENERPVFIDFSQSTSLKNPNAEEYLVRDVRNISNFFRKQGLKVDEESVLKKIKV